MTVRQAIAEGLIFTGIWERDYKRNIARDRAKQIREKYKCRAVLVNEDGGVSVYTDEKYEKLKHMEDLEGRLKVIPATRERLLGQLAELDEEERRLSEKIAEIKELYNIEERI